MSFILNSFEIRIMKYKIIKCLREPSIIVETFLLQKMNLLLCCIVAALSVANAAIDVERTVKQVQTILQANSQLPRLSRDEIIQLLNDIRAEDAKSKSASTEQSKEVVTDIVTKPYNSQEIDVNPTQIPNIDDNVVADEKQNVVSVSAPIKYFETTTQKESTVMVVLPYTPRDGASLQELYTRPPRVEVVPESKITPRPISVKPSDKLQETLKSNAKFASQQKFDIPSELQAFLDAHGLKGKPGQDNFLLPLEGFKPLPPARIIDGTVQLPENILLTYDLISPDSVTKQAFENAGPQQPNNFLYEPLRPQFPFELDSSSSEDHKIVLPLDMPKKRTTKSAAVTPASNYDPIDYDSIKVIPLNKGPNPLEDDKVALGSEQNKRQANVTSENEEPTTTPSSDAKEAVTNAPPSDDSAAADTDSGASIADLEDSFGGAAPVEPGDSELPPPRKNGFYWMVDWNSFLEVGDGDTKVNIHFEPKLGDPQMFLPVNVP